MSTQDTYKYSIEQCDIQDKEKGEEFREKRLEWINWLEKDINSIFRQITSMVWDYALFRIVNKLREWASKQPDENVSFNNSVLRLFDVGFVTTQAVAIRRLIDKRKDVISLYALLEDIEKNIDLLTRENYVCYDGLPYDYESVRQEEVGKLIFKKGVSGVRFVANEGPEGWAPSERTHKYFDELSGVNPKKQKREKDDQVKIDILKFLEKQINECKEIKNITRYVNKFIAHSATPESRAGLTQEQMEITLNQLEICYKTIWQVAGYISSQLLFESGISGLPTPQFDHLENLDKSWATPAILKKAHEEWRKIEEEIEEWDTDLPERVC